MSIDGRLVEEVKSHCHLGLRLQHDGRWKQQIDYMTSRAESRLSILKAYGRKFQRQPLLKIYLSYIRPLLEYGGFIWCNITKGEVKQLESVQLAALRVLSGCKSGTNHFRFYNEFDLPTLERRRFISRMVKFYEVLHRSDVERMNSNSFAQVGDRNPYSSRRGHDISILLAKTEQCRMSFRSQCVRDWNNLPVSIRTLESKRKFKIILQIKPSPPVYYGIELNRTSSINLARLRCGNANLNYNLFLRNLCDTPTCDCGDGDETIAHYLLHCRRFSRARRDAKDMMPCDMWSADTILHGSTTRFSDEDNATLCIIAQKYIEATARF